MKQDIFNGNSFFKSNELNDKGLIIKSGYFDKIKEKADKKLEEGEAETTKEASQKAKIEVDEEQEENEKMKKVKKPKHETFEGVMHRWGEGKLHHGKTKKIIPKGRQDIALAVAFSKERKGK